MDFLDSSKENLPKGWRAIAEIVSESGSPTEKYIIARSRGGKRRPTEAPAVCVKEGESLRLVPDTRNRVASHVHIAGPSGTGKSTWAGEYARTFKEYGGGKVIVISADVEDDPALSLEDGTIDVRLPVSPELDEIQLEELSSNGTKHEGTPTLIIFDDVEGVKAEARKSLLRFEQAVKERGRKLNLHSISIYHKGAANKTTSASLNEATSFLVFPQAITNNIAYMLQKYARIPPEILSVIKKNDGWGSWINFDQKAPQCMIGEHRAALVDESMMAAIAKAEKQRLMKEATKEITNARAYEEN